MTADVLTRKPRIGGIGKFMMEMQNLRAINAAKDEQISALRRQIRTQAIEHAAQVKSLKDKIRKAP
jgi:hypothetical protein